MAKMKAGDHGALATYPDDPRPAIDLVLGHLNGETPDTKDLAHAGWHLIGYGLSKFDPHDPAPVAKAGGKACDDEELKKHLEQAKAECDGQTKAKGAMTIPWALIVQAVLDLIQEILNKPQPKPDPAP